MSEGRAGKDATGRTRRRTSDWFGFDPKSSEHHFELTIPRSEHDDVLIRERYRWREDDASDEAVTIDAATRIGEDGALRCMLSGHRWRRVEAELRLHFNGRLRAEGRSAGRWRIGRNPIRLDFGKELTLLAWAMEEADPGKARIALVNWLGLEPAERWWLYTQIAAASGHALHGRDAGWRKAIRYALTENSTEHSAGQLDGFLRIAEDSSVTKSGRTRASARAATPAVDEAEAEGADQPALIDDPLAATDGEAR